MVGSIVEVVVTGDAVNGYLAAITWPDPADVRRGVQYGPTGADYTGTMEGGSIVLMRRR
jgi:hypothetical protein